MWLDRDLLVSPDFNLFSESPGSHRVYSREMPSSAFHFQRTMMAAKENKLHVGGKLYIVSARKLAP